MQVESAFVLFLILSCIQGRRHHDRAWYVSLLGADDVDCGYSLVSPCQSLVYILSLARENDIVLIDGAPTRNGNDIYEMCSGNKGEIFSSFGTFAESLTLRGYNGAPKIGCNWEHVDLSKGSHQSKREAGEFQNITMVLEDDNEKNNMTYKLADEKETSTHPAIDDTATSLATPLREPYKKIIPYDQNNCSVTLRDVEFVNGIITFANCTVSIINVIFQNSSLITPNECEHIDLTIRDSVWYGSHVCESEQPCTEQQISNATCLHVHVSIENTQYYQTTFAVEGKITTQVFVNNSLFSNRPEVFQYLGGLHLTFAAHYAFIVIENTKFEKQLHPARVQSVINLYQASLWLKSISTFANQFHSNATVTIYNCVFQDNERGITMVGPFVHILVENTLFLRNTAIHAGAAILLLIAGNKEAIIANCTFQDNRAGQFRSDYPVKEKPGEFEIFGSEVHLNAECCKGVVELVGKGGAVRVQRGITIIVLSKFINNTARLLGGSIFVDIDGNLTVHSTYFENTPVSRHSLQGDVLYSDGRLNVNDVALNVRTAHNGLSIFRHSGDHWTLEITNVWIECPVGYNIRTTNSSAYGVTDEGLRRSYKLDQLSYYCESCPRNKYSLDHGYLNYTTKAVSREFAYFTLLINGSEPSSKHSDQYMHHTIECKDCPYGGHCSQGISSVANFWGYAQNESVKFQHCPRGYCCDKHVCPSINPCNNLRQGRLCGRCKEGYSEALFSPHCIPNEKCGVLWLYPFSGAVGLIYAVFLLFQADLQAFLFSKPLGFTALYHKFTRRKKKTYLNGKLNTASGKSTAPLEDSQFIPNGDINEKHNSNGHAELSACDSIENATVLEPSNFGERPSTKKRYNDCGFGSGFLVIMFYYFQDALLLNVETVFIKEESKGQQLMKSILSGIFKFQLDVFELLEGVCTYANMTAVPNNLSKALIVPYVIGLFIVMYILHKITSICRVTSPLSNTSTTISSSAFEQCYENDHNRNNSEKNRSRKSFATRLASGFILALLFMFQKLGTTTFILLNCVPINNNMVLFIDGEVECYQRWQYVVMLYATVCVTPFFLVLLFGPCMLQNGVISLTEFFLASLIPLPYLIFWLCRHIITRNRKQNGRRQNKRLPNSVMAVLVILQGPFKQNNFGLCWSGVLIGRRLVLILLFTFVTDSLFRLLLMLLACFIILLHHVHAKPYRDGRGNLAGTISAAALVVLGSINLVRAGFEAAEYTPTGPNAFLMQVFSEVENALLLWGPLAVLVLIGLVFVYRISAFLFRCLFRHQTQHTNETYNGSLGCQERDRNSGFSS